MTRHMIRGFFAAAMVFCVGSAGAAGLSKAIPPQSKVAGAVAGGNRSITQRTEGTKDQGPSRSLINAPAKFRPRGAGGGAPHTEREA